MATITDELVLDITQPLRQFDNLEKSLDESVTSARDLTRELDQTGDATRDAARFAADFESRLSAAERSASDLNAEISSIEISAGRSVADFRELAQALDVSEDEAARLTAELIDASVAARRVEESARDVARQLGLSDEQAQDLVRSLNRADRAAADISTRTGALAGSFGTLRTAAAGVAGILATIGVSQGIALAARGAVNAVNQFQALNESVNAVNVTFETGADAIFEFGEISAQAAGLSAQAFQQAVVPIGAVLRNFGFDAREAADASIILVQRAADLASVFNTDVGEALTAINAALVGQVEPLRRFGAEISVARVEAFALANGLAASKSDIDNVILTQARLALILQDTNRAAGDFVNTSAEFANASRIARADVDELAASAGEALLPAFEALLAAIPELVAGLETGLVPALADAATQVAALVTSIQAGAGDSFADETVAAITGLGAAFDGLKAPIDLVSIATGAFSGNFRQAGEGITQFTQRIDNQLIRGSLNRLIGRMQEGTTASQAFADEIVSIGVTSSSLDLLEQGFLRLVGTAGLAGPELEVVLENIITTGAASGLTAEAIRFLSDQAEILANTLHPVGTELTNAAFTMGVFGDSLPQAAARFTTFTGQLEEARTTITQTLRGLADDSEGQQQRLAQALDPFAELPEQIDLSAKEALKAITAQFEAIAAFEANVIQLAATAPNLALELFEKGPAAADLIANFLDAPALAAEAERVLSGVATAGVLALTEDLAAALTRAGLDQTTAARFAALFTNSNVINAVTQGAIQSANAGTSAYRDALTSGFDQLIPEVGDEIGRSVETHWVIEAQAETAAARTAQSYVDGVLGFNIQDRIQDIFDTLTFASDLSDEGADAASSYASGFQEELARRREDIGDAIESVTRNALQMNSPSELMLALGRQAGGDLIAGFAQGANRPIPVLTGMQIGGPGGLSTPSGTVNNFSNQNIINNPVARDILSESSRLEQLTGAVTANLRGF